MLLHHRAAAKAGGAHFVHTDYPNGWTSVGSFSSPYTVTLSMADLADTTEGHQATPVKAMVCNPVTAPKRCFEGGMARLSDASAFTSQPKQRQLLRLCQLPGQSKNKVPVKSQCFSLF